MNGDFWLLGFLLTAAAYTDLRYHRLPNVLNLCGGCSGLLYHINQCGLPEGLQTALFGAGTGLFLMMILYGLGAVGAGDVKLFAAIGALCGPGLTASIAMYSLFCSGGIAVGILIWKGSMRWRLLRVTEALYGLLVQSDPGPLQSIRNRRNVLRFPFMLAVLPGTVFICLERLYG